MPEQSVSDEFIYKAERARKYSLHTAPVKRIYLIPSRFSAHYCLIRVSFLAPEKVDAKVFTCSIVSVLPICCVLTVAPAELISVP